MLMIAAYGAYVFAKRDFITYMLLKSEFVFLDFGEPKLLFYLNYLALMGLGVFVAHYGAKALTVLGGDQDSFLRAMGEAGKSVSDYLGSGERIVYVNVMNRLSVDCDCVGNPAEPDIHDIGILASTDPVALDQACIDLIYEAEGNEALVRRIEGRNGLLTLEHAEKVGLGSRTYALVDIDA
jgi:hypothetical protein